MIPASHSKGVSPWLVFFGVLAIGALFMWSAVSGIRQGANTPAASSDSVSSDSVQPAQRAPSSAYPDTSTLTVMEMSDRLSIGMTAHQIGLAVGVPDKVQKSMDNYQESSEFYYKRRDGVLQIQLDPYRGLISYHTY